MSWFSSTALHLQLLCPCLWHWVLRLMGGLWLRLQWLSQCKSSTGRPLYKPQTYHRRQIDRQMHTGGGCLRAMSKNVQAPRQVGDIGSSAKSSPLFAGHLLHVCEEEIGQVGASPLHHAP